MITGEEFVVKIKADASGMNKSAKELSQQLEKLSKQSGSLGDALTQAMTFKSGIDVSGFTKAMGEIDKQSLKMKNKLGKRLSLYSELMKSGTDETKDLLLSQLDLNDKIPKKVAEQFKESEGNSIYSLYKNKYQGILEGYAQYRELNNQKGEAMYTAMQERGTPKGQNALLKYYEMQRKISAMDEAMTDSYGGKWKKLRDAEFPADKIADYTEKQEKAEKEQGGFLKKSWQIIKTVLIWNTLRKAIQSVISLFQTGIKNAYQYSKKTGGALSKVLDEFNSKKTALANAFGAFWANFIVAFKPYMTVILKWIANVFNTLSKLVAEMFNLPTYLTANLDIFAEWQSCIDETKELISGFDELNIFSGDNSGNTEIEDMFTTHDRSEEKSTWQQIKDWFTTSVYNPVKTWVIDKWEIFKGWVKDFWSWLKDTVWSGLKEWWNGYTIYSTDEETGETWITDKKTGMWETITSTLKETFADLKLWLFGDDSGVEGVWQKTILPWLETAWETFKTWITKVWNETIVPALETFAEAIGDWVVKKIKAWLGIKEAPVLTQAEYDEKYTVKETGNAFVDFWKYFFRNYPQTGTTVVPNAAGGVYTSPTLGLVGEYSGANNNPELITPQSLMLDTMNQSNGQVVNALVQCCRQLITAIDNKDMDVVIGDNAIASACARGNNSYNKMTGKALF